MPQLSLFLLGSPGLELDGAPLEINRRKAIALLAYLAVTDQSHSRDALATLLWPELDQSRARGALRRTLSELNTILDSACLLIERESVALDHSSKLWVDVDQFQQLAAAAQTHEVTNDEIDPQDIAPLAEAAQLYRDDFLAGFTLRDAPGFDEWQFFQAESLRQTFGRVLEQLVTAYSNRDDYEPALEYARRWLALDSLHEPAHRRLMELYAWTDRRAAALRQYQTCVQILAEELGITPSAETTRLYERIRTDGAGRGAALRHALPQEPEQSNGAEKTYPDREKYKPENGSQQDHPLPLTKLPPFSLGPLPPRTTIPFVAREQELTQLNQYLDMALNGQGQIVFIAGQAGAGKTALVQEFACQAQDANADLIVALGECNAHTGLGDPYRPFREILSLLTGEIEARWMRGAITRKNAQRIWNLLPVSLQTLLNIGPGLIDAFIPKATVDTWVTRLRLDQANMSRLEINGERLTRTGESAETAQSDLFEQYAKVLQTLAKTQPLLLIVDDAQWADAASISLLFHLSRQLFGSRILLLATYRPDEVALGRNGGRHPLEPILNEIRRTHGDVCLDLDRTMNEKFVDLFLDTEPNRLGPKFRAALYHQTQGHPLFTVELLREMQERGHMVYREPDGWVEVNDLNWTTLPARVEAVIEERIGRLEPELRNLLAVASVEGEQFTAQVITQVQGLDERQLLGDLSQMLEQRHHLVREQCEIQVGPKYLACYRFTHTLFQQYLYNKLGAGERRLLHGEVAAAMEKLYAEEYCDDVTVQLAHHYVAAGQIEKAVEYLLRAGDRARNLRAHPEAADFYQQALDFLKQQNAYNQAARTLMKLGLTHHLTFNFGEARRAYREGFALWQQASARDTAALPPAPHPFRQVQYADPITLDPTLAADNQSGDVVRQLFSGLLTLTPEMDVVPEVARDWEVVDDGRRYIFHLHDDIYWSDGTPLTAEDFVYAWRRVLDPAINSHNADYLFDVKGAKAFHQGQLANFEQVGMQALDPLTLTIELEEPTSYFPQLVASWQLFPIPRRVVTRYGQAWTRPEHIVTNGPFKLKCWQPGQELILERNPDYRGQATGNVQQVALHIGIPATVELEMYEAGQLDIMRLHPSLEMNDIRRRFAADYFSGPMLHTQYISFDTRRPPFDDLRVRRAFALAIDKEALASIVLSGYYFPATGGFVPPGMPGHSPDIGLPYDPEQARRLLAEAGYPAGRHFPAVELLVKVRHGSESAFLQSQWRENLGIELIWQAKEWGQMLARLEEAPPYLFQMGWAADYPDPDNFLRVAVHQRERLGWRNETYEKLVEQARRSANQAERLNLYRQADKILIEDVVVIPLLHGQGHTFLKPWISKFPTSAVNWGFLKDVVIEPH